MVIKLSAADWRAIFPRAPQEVIEAFAAKQAFLDKAGITASQTRLAYFLANIEHECGGFSIRNLTENINYTAARMAAVWPNRFKSAAAVRAKYGIVPGWQLRAFDDIYGNRMGNRPGTDDGSRYIGRGGPQWTGRDGYAALERLTGLPPCLIRPSPHGSICSRKSAPRSGRGRTSTASPTPWISSDASGRGTAAPTGSPTAGRH